MNWYFKTFHELTSLELFYILQARSEVFVVEQNCPYLDPEECDLFCIHVFAQDNNKIAAYLRIVPAGKKYKEVSIGRVLTTAQFRTEGYGRLMMKKAMDYIAGHMGESKVRISAQAYLEEFYKSFGFCRVSEEYLEDNIPHVEMLFE